MIFKCTSSLRLFSDSMTVAELAELLKCKPDSSYEKGDTISSVSNGKRKQSMCSKTVASNGQDCIENCLTEMAALVAELTESLLAAENVSTDVFTGMFSDNEQLNFYIPLKFSQALSAANLDHSISGYTTGNDKENN